jgi:hypothetical protein
MTDVAGDVLALYVDRSWQVIGGAATLFTLLAAALVVVAAAKGVFMRTVGRRREHYRRLERLGANAHVAFFNAVLGSPPALRKTVGASITSLPELGGVTTTEAVYQTHVALFYNQLRQFDVDEFEAGASESPGESTGEIELTRVPIVLTELVWVDRDYYVQGLADDDGSVLAFSVTTRNRRFRPTFYGAHVPITRRGWLPPLRRRDHLFRVKLGSTSFAAIGDPSNVYAFLGMHRYAYYETYWFGNPGSYQHFIFTSNDAGSPPWPDFQSIFPQGGGGAVRWPDQQSTSDVDALPGFAEFRRRTMVNTYTVIGPRFHLEDYPLSYGPELNEVRTLP